jgi:hypothetical protein
MVTLYRIYVPLVHIFSTAPQTVSSVRDITDFINLIASWGITLPSESACDSKVLHSLHCELNVFVEI